VPYRDLGAHVDGFIAVVAHTIVLGATSEAKVSGRRADVVLAAHYASQAALRLLKPENDVSMSQVYEHMLLLNCNVAGYYLIIIINFCVLHAVA
jgi:methionine aminopeptidase